MVRLLGSTYHFEVEHSRLTGQVTLALPVSGVASGTAPVWLAYFNGKTGRWVPVPSRYDRKTHTVTGTSTHLSVWSVIGLDTAKVTEPLAQAVKGFFGIADAAQPSCPGSASAAGIKVSSSSGDLVKWCAGTNSGQAVLRVTNNHGYAVEVDFPQTWSITRVGRVDDWETRLLDNISSWLSPQPNGQRAIVVPGGGEIQFTVPAGASGEAVAKPSGQSVLASAFILGVETLAMTYDDLPGWPSSKPSQLTRVVRLVDHSHSCVSAGESLIRNSTVSARSLGTLIRSDTDLATDCLGQEWETGFGLTGGIASAAISVLLWAADAIKLLVNDTLALVNAVRYLMGYQIVVRLLSTGANCSSSAITAGVKAFAKQSFGDVESFGCSGNFAYAFADISIQGNKNSVTVLLMQRAGKWVPVNRATYCSDHAVPESIYFNACETQ